MNNNIDRGGRVGAFQPRWLRPTMGCGLLAALLSPLPAAAQTSLQASAYTTSSVQPTIGGSSGVVAAYYPDAQAPLAQAHSMVGSSSASAIGTGTTWEPNLQGNYSYASNSWHYQLWDPATAQPLDHGAAFGVRLLFQLRLTGSVSVPADASSPRGTVILRGTVLARDSIFGQITSDDFTQTADMTYSSVFGHYSMGGNAALFGSYDLHERLFHDGGESGTFTATTSASASGSGAASASLQLESVELVGGIWPQNRPIVLRLDDGTVIPIALTPVPEPATWLMWCAAGLAGLLRWRTHSRTLPVNLSTVSGAPR